MPRRWDECFADKRALVTGGAGFIGSRVAQRLVALRARVTVVDALIPGCGGNLWNLAPVAQAIRFEQLDLRERARLEPLVLGADYIFNLAGQVSHIDSMSDPSADREINCDSHLALLEVCRRANPQARIVYAGTRQQYGRPQYVPVDERHPLRPADINGVNKYAGEAYHLLYHRLHGLRTSSLRLTNTFGPGLLIRHSRQGFLSVFIRRVLEDDVIRVFGDGRQLRDLNYVDDVVEAFLAVAADDALAGEVFNLGSREVLSLRQVAELFVAIAGSGRLEVVPFPAELKRIDIGSYYGDFTRIREATGWEPRITIAEGLRRTIAYYRQHATHYLEEPA
jgi:nucleoside-diphosphate-sugar epimerase